MNSRPCVVALLCTLIVGIVACPPSLQGAAAATAATPTPPPARPGQSAKLVDLAALALVPSDVDEPGYGNITGRYQTLDEVASSLNSLEGGTDADLPSYTGALTDAGWKQTYFDRIGIASGDDPSKYGTVIYNALSEHADGKGATAGYDLLREANAAAGYLKARGGATVDDKSVYTRRQGTASDGTTYQELDLEFLSGTFVVEIDLVDYTDEAPAVATIQALGEALGDRLAKAGEIGIGFGPKALRLKGNGVATSYEYYKRISGAQVADYGQTLAQVRSDDRYYKGLGITDIYFLGQTAPVAGSDTNMVDYWLSLYRFGKAADAKSTVSDWSKNFVDNPPSGYTDLAVAARPAKIGTASTTVTYSRTDSGGSTVQGVTVYAATTDVLAIVTVEAVAGATQQSAETIATAAVKCLGRTTACARLAIPTDLIAGGA
jgi:hypothetical protein